MRLSLRHWEFPLLLLFHDLLLSVFLVDPGMVVIDQIYMLNPPLNSKRTAIMGVKGLGIKGTENP